MSESLARNPFPYLGTLRLAGRRMDEGVPVVVGELRTLLREPISRLIEGLNSFLGRFDAYPSNAGGVAILCGPHGSGKTHTIFAAWETLRPRKDVFPVYVLQQNPDLMSLYVQVAKRLSPELLQALGGSMLGLATAEQASTDSICPAHADSGAKAELSAMLQTDPEKAKHLLGTYRVQAGATRVRQEKTLLDVTQGNKELARIVQCLQGDQYASDAAAWLMADSGNPENLRAMGISEAIETPAQISAALELLVGLFTLAGRPLVLFIDQFEKLLPNDDPGLANANVGHLRSLAESFANRNGMLVLAGTEDAWNRMPEDFRQRFGLTVVSCSLLREDEATDIVRLYVTPHTESWKPGAGSIHPFTEGAIRRMLSAGAGNLRRFLQLCYLSWQTAAPAGSLVDESMIRAIAAGDVSGQFVNFDFVLSETKRLLRKGPLTVAEHHKSCAMDFALALLNPQGKAVVLLDVKEAAFARDEAVNALLSAGTAARLKAAADPAVYALVVTGYVSPEIVDQLTRAVDELIVFTPDRYEACINDMIERARSRLAAPAASAPPAVPEIDINSAIKGIVQERAQSETIVQSRAEDSTSYYGEKRFEERREFAARDWGEMRRALEERIAEERKSAQERAIGEVGAAVGKGNKDRWTRSFGLTIAYAALLILGGVNWVLHEMELHNTEVTLFTYIDGIDRFMRHNLFPWAVLAALIVWLMYDWSVVLTPDLATPPGSLADIRRLSRSRRLLTQFRSFDPLPRLARHSRAIRNGVPLFRLTNRLYSEPIPFFRQVYCEAFGASERAQELPQGLPGKDWPPPSGLTAEWATLMQDARVAPRLPGFGQPPFDLVFAAATGEGREGSRLALDLLAGSGPVEVTIDGGADPIRVSSPEFLSARAIRAAAQELSPFEEGGAGTFHHLRCIAQIDYAFLRCKQLELYQERGVLRVPDAPMRKGEDLRPDSA